MVSHIKNENFEAFGIRMTTEMQNLFIKDQMKQETWWENCKTI